MERFRTDDQGAFQMLVRSSQDTNMKVIAVAQWLNDTVDAGASRGRRAPAPH